MILVHVAFQVGFCTFVLANYMKTIPKEISEAAAVDGAGVLRQYFQVVLPSHPPSPGGARHTRIHVALQRLLLGCDADQPGPRSADHVVDPGAQRAILLGLQSRRRGVDHDRPADALRVHRRCRSTSSPDSRSAPTRADVLHLRGRASDIVVDVSTGAPTVVYWGAPLPSGSRARDGHDVTTRRPWRARRRCAGLGRPRARLRHIPDGPACWASTRRDGTGHRASPPTRTSTPATHSPCAPSTESPVSCSTCRSSSIGRSPCGRR